MLLISGPYFYLFDRMEIEKIIKDELLKEPDISDEDLRAALGDMKGYVDVTEEDLKKIYLLALQHARERLAFSITVRDAMTKEVISVRKDTCLDEIVKLLSEHRISGLPVVDDAHNIAGIVTEADILSMTGMKRGHTFKDILRHVIGEPLPGHRTGNRAEEIMTSPAVTITPERSVREAASILDERKIKRLPVVDGSGRLLGIISRGDIVRTMGRK